MYTEKNSGSSAWKNVSIIVFTVSGLILLSSVPCRSQNAVKNVKEGNKLYTEKKYDGALNKYQDALLDKPASNHVQYDIGTALHKMKKFDKSLEKFNESLASDDPALQALAYYNLGNTLYRANKLQESIAAYTEALKLNPDDEDAKYNIEFVRNKIKENADKQNQQNQNDQQQQQQEKKDQQQKQEGDKKKEQQQQQQQQSQEDKQAGKEKKLTKEEAEQLLNALKEDQKKLKKKNARSGGKTRVVKDW